MAVKEFKITFPGQQINPRIGHMLTSDNLATASAAGYLNPYITAGTVNLKPTDVVLCAASDGTQWYKPVFSVNGTVTLTVLP